jgi:hypothetical protein
MVGRFLRCAAILVVVGVFLGGGTAFAGHAGSCPDGFQRVDASVDPVVNKNGDEWICTKQIGGPPGTTVFTDIDNNAQLKN